MSIGGSSFLFDFNFAVATSKPILCWGNREAIAKPASLANGAEISTLDQSI